MKLFGYNISQISNVDKKQNERERITTSVTEVQTFRETETITKWRAAIGDAEKITPNLLPLLRQYNETLLDAHVQAVIGTRVNKLLSTEWCLRDANGDIDEIATDLINKKWFQQVRKYINEAVYYGFSLIQLGSIINDEFSDVTLVPRINVVPKLKGVMKSASSSFDEKDLLLFKEKPYNFYTIFADTQTLGLLLQITPHAIWKKNAIGFWARYLELFGMPVRIGKTDIADKERRANMSNMLKNMSSAAWATFDRNDTIEFVQNSGNASTGNTTFNDMTQFNNAEISKVVLGQTMTTDNGSSRSQAEVHERVADIYLQADQHFEESTMNTEVLPLLEFHRLIPAGLRFEHLNYESMEIKIQKIQALKEMVAAGFIIDPLFAEQYTGIDIAGVGEVLDPKKIEKPDNNSVMKMVHDLYKNYIKE